jgi:hypothetical protein
MKTRATILAKSRLSSCPGPAGFGGLRSSLGGGFERATIDPGPARATYAFAFCMKAMNAARASGERKRS